MTRREETCIYKAVCTFPAETLGKGWPPIPRPSLACSPSKCISSRDRVTSDAPESNPPVWLGAGNVANVQSIDPSEVCVYHDLRFPTKRPDLQSPLIKMSMRLTKTLAGNSETPRTQSPN